MSLRAFVGILIASVLLVWAAAAPRSDAVDPLNIQDNAQLPASAFAAHPVIGQTIVSHEARLSAIQIRWVVSDDFSASGTGYVTMHLRSRPQDAADLAAASVPAGEIQQNGFSKFAFAPLQDSSGQTYYFFIDLDAAGVQSGGVGLWASAEDDYPDGQMYVNGEAIAQDLAFRTYYDPDLVMLIGQWGDMLARDGVAVLLAALFLVIPGAALFFLFGRLGAHWIDTIAWASGLGLAALAAGSILWLWLGPLGQVALYAALLVLVLAALRALVSRVRVSVPRPRPPAPEAFLYALLGVLALLSLSVNLIQIHDVSVPLWVDSVTHAGYIKGVLDQGQLPASGFYHLGFHAVTGLYARLTALSIPQAMLVVGQLLITLTGLGAFLLARRLSGSTLAGLVAAACVWFISPTPSYFITWGRYPLLMGSALLPLALCYAVDLLEEPRLTRSSLFLAAVAFAGLAFSQVRLIAFYASFVVIYMTYQAVRQRQMRLPLARMGILAAVGGLVAVVWLGRLVTQGVTGSSILALNASAPEIDLATAYAVSFYHLGMGFWVLALFTLAVGILRGSRVAWISFGWYIVLCLASFALSAPAGGEYVPLSLVVLMGFLPAAMIVGDGVEALYLTCLRSQPTWAGAAVGAILFLVALLGARDMISIVNPATVLFSEADEGAMAFIRERVPAGSRFLINSFAWSGQAYVPSDGGGWIPYLARASTQYLDLPPADAGALANRLQGDKVSYVYLGRRAGLLSKSDFTAHPDHYALIYAREGIQILQVKEALGSSLPSQTFP